MSPLTVQQLAEHKQLPEAFLRGLGLRDTPRGVEIPYFEETGAAVGVKLRYALKACEGSRWEQAKRLSAYGRDRLGGYQGPHLHLVEGESDCWALWHHGYQALGIPGASCALVLQAGHPDPFDPILIHQEPDRGGELFVQGLVARLRKLGYRGRVIVYRLPGFKDPADLHAQAAERFRDVLEQAILDGALIDLGGGDGLLGGGVPRPTPPTNPPEPPNPADPADPADPPDPAAGGTLRADRLLAATLPAVPWVVPGLLPPGLTVLAGKPKLGKSWLALHLALAAALGRPVLGRFGPVAAGEVLYLALEDTPRRLQARLATVCAQLGGGVPDRLHCRLTSPRLDAGGWEQLDGWLTAHPQARLVVLDVWIKLRPGRKGGDLYQEDSDHAAQVKRLADDHGVAVLLITHTRKLPSSDPVDTITGTLGTAGAADTLWLLDRGRGEAEGRLFVTGRDVEEQEWALRRDAARGGWTGAEEPEPAAEPATSPDRQRILALLRAEGGPRTAQELAEALARPLNGVKSLVGRMVGAGQLVRYQGRFAPPEGFPDPPDPKDPADPGGSPVPPGQLFATADELAALKL